MLNSIESQFAYYGGILNSYNDINKNPLMQMALQPLPFSNNINFNNSNFNNSNPDLVFNNNILNKTITPFLEQTTQTDNILAKLMQIFNNRNNTQKISKTVEVPAAKTVESNGSQMSELKAAQILNDNLDFFDQAAGIGKKDYLICKEDLETVAKNYSPEFEQQRLAAQFILDNLKSYDALDTSYLGGQADAIIGGTDLQVYLEKHGSQKKQVVSNIEKQAPQETHVIPEKPVNSYENKKTGITEDQKQLIIGHFDWFASLSGQGKGELISTKDLEAVTQTTWQSQLFDEKRKVAQFLLDNQKAFSDLDAAGNNNSDGFISIDDIKNYAA